ncbi:hypothetical protein [Reichenbachiella sp.]
MQIIKFKSELSEPEILRIAEERKPLFSGVPGLIQKSYVVKQEDEIYGGVYLWESQEALQAFRSSELAKSIPTSYKIIGAPSVELMEVKFQLR